jgi:D-alanyl-D-alanine carboxypeptidase (penicillin-binding protein 5/6)
VSSSSSARPAARHAQRSVHRALRRRALLGAALLLAVGATAFAAARHSITYGNQVSLAVPRTPPADHHPHPPTISWPQQGQAAFVLGNGRPEASPDQQPAPIASLAKVMTAYLTLERYPLGGEQEGFTTTFTAEQAQAEAGEAADGASVVAVRAGEQLTERQLLEALLIPSGNNIAHTLAALVAGSETRFVADMNAETRALGMSHTIYTDPSGRDPGTVSTAADQLRVLRRAMRFTAFRQIVSMARVTLPVAGTLSNFNPLVAEGYAGKTGSDAAAGGCLAFFTPVTVNGRRLMASGVVMGQGEGRNTAAILAAAGDAAKRMVDSVAAGGDAPMLPAPGSPDGQ